LRKRTIDLILSLICVTFILLTVIPLYLGYCVGPRITRQILEGRVNAVFQHGVHLERARITVFGGFGIELSNLRIPQGGEADFLRVKTVLLKPWIKSLLVGRVRWKGIIFREPSIQLIRTAQGDIHGPWKKVTDIHHDQGKFVDVLKGFLRYLPAYLSVREGRVRFLDQGTSRPGLVTDIEKLEMTSHVTSSGEHLSFTIRGRCVEGSGARFSMSGRIAGLKRLFDSCPRDVEIALRAGNIDCRWIWPYVRQATPCDDMQGLLDLSLSLTGGFTSFHSSGKIRIRQGYFAIPRVYTDPIEISEVSLDFDCDYGRKELQLTQVVLHTPHFSMSGSGIIQSPDPDNRLLSLKFETGKTLFSDILPYLPDRFIPDRLVSFLTTFGLDGSFRIEEATLEGPWSDFTAEGLQKNPDALSARIRLDNFRLVPDPALPPFQNISGLLLVHGDQLIADHLHGQRRGLRSFGLEGSLSHLGSDPSVALKFTGDIDLGDFFPLVGADQMPSQMREGVQLIKRISGKARIKGELQHALHRPSDLHYSGRVSLRDIRLRIAGLPQPLIHGVGEIRCDEKQVHLSRFRCQIGTSPLEVKASIRDYLTTRRTGLCLSNEPKVSLDLGLDKMVLEDFLPTTDQRSALRIGSNSTLATLIVSGVIRASEGSFKRLHFQNLDASFVLRRGVLRFKHLHAEGHGGFVRCNGWLNLTSQRALSFKLIPRIHGLDLATTLGIIPGLEHRKLLSGALDLEGIVTGGGQSFDEIVASLAGDLRVCAGKGIIHRLDNQGKGELPYDRATGRILIRNGLASTKDLHVESDAVSMVIRGTANLHRRYLDILIGARPLQTVDKILSNVPLAGWLLAGKDRSILTFSFRVRGPFHDLSMERGRPLAQVPMAR
jgi:hypothetical protein